MSSSKVKILFISHSSALYGSERCLLDLIVNLPNSIVPIVIMPSNGLLNETIKTHNIETHIIKFRGWWYRRLWIKFIYRALINFSALIRLYIKFKDRNINLIYTNTIHSPIGIVLSRMLGVKHIQHCHEYLNLNNSANFDFGLNLSARFISENSATIICTSYAHKLDLQRHIDAAKINIVYNGTNFERNIAKTSFSPKKSFQILMIGSISRNKNQLLALKALNSLSEDGFNVDLKILGDSLEPKYQLELNQYIMENNLKSYVSFLGFKENVQEYLSNSDLLLVCSNNETFGRVIIEAMATNVVVVSSALPSISEIIIHRYSGLLYPTNNLALLTDCINTLMNDSNLRLKLIENARLEYLNKFKLEIYIKNITNLINRTVNNNE
jgi:glycosyltransferase involved in cell wall biosynthesis